MASSYGNRPRPPPPPPPPPPPGPMAGMAAPSHGSRTSSASHSATTTNGHRSTNVNAAHTNSRSQSHSSRSSGGTSSSTSTSTSTSNLLAQPTPNLESRLSLLRTESTNLSTTLTQRLATSQSGQNLLHIGPSLQSLPPDLHSLLKSLRPILDEVEQYETSSRGELGRIVDCGNSIRTALRRVREAEDCSEIYDDLCQSEGEVRAEGDRLRKRGGGAGGGGGGGRSSGSGGGRGRNVGFVTPTKGGGRRGSGGGIEDSVDGGIDDWDDPDGTDDCSDELDHVASLERAAHTTLHLVQELKSSTAEVTSLTSVHKPDVNTTNTGDTKSSTADAAASSSSTAALPNLRAPLPDDTDKAQFLMKLAPRIRRLEADTVRALTARLEEVLGQMKSRKDDERESGTGSDGGGGGSSSSSSSAANGAVTATSGTIGTDSAAEERDLLMIGHCLRGLALLGRGKEAEGAFARVAIMPLIRSKVSMGRLDEGGARGQCTGLSSLLDDIAQTIYASFGSVLQLSEATFGATDAGPVEIDLVTAGVWAPLATALMADPAIKMALFSPGIAGILQANYTALDSFLGVLASSLLKDGAAEGDGLGGTNTAAAIADGSFAPLYFRPAVSADIIQAAQARLYRHPLTTDFNKKWNLPIYYQLRFGECCTRLNKAMTRVQEEGWEADVYTGDEAFSAELRNKLGFELPLFLELYDALVWLWRPDVVLRPLSHRFLRGATQLVGRLVAFIRDGLEGRIRFGEKPPPKIEPKAVAGDQEENGSAKVNGDHNVDPDSSYVWGERLEDVAAVAWELTLLESSITHDYAETVAATIAPPGASSTNNESELEDLRGIISDALVEASQDIAPMIRQSWSDVIVGILTAKCSAPLSAVKGVAATYRMTNRPPPQQPSPFVSTILRPLSEFYGSYSSRTPPQVGERWKMAIVYTVSERYSAAVEELIATVERTESALKSRKIRRAASGASGMSDGDKVKLQLFLDHKEFADNVSSLGLDVDTVPGLVELKALTEAAVTLHAQNVAGY